MRGGDDDDDDVVNGGSKVVKDAIRVNEIMLLVLCPELASAHEISPDPCLLCPAHVIEEVVAYHDSLLRLASHVVQHCLEESL